MRDRRQRWLCGSNAVLHVTAELYPWVKSGGLGDVAAALPLALTASVSTPVAVAGFAGFLDAFSDHHRCHPGATPFAAERVRMALGRLPGTARLRLSRRSPGFLRRPGNPYAGPEAMTGPTTTGGLASSAGRGGARARRRSRWRPGILHCHDWHPGLAPAYLAGLPPSDGP